MAYVALEASLRTIENNPVASQAPWVSVELPSVTKSVSSPPTDCAAGTPGRMSEEEA